MKKHESWKNLENYRKGKEPLRHAVVQHPEESEKSIFDYVKGKVKRRFWVKPYEKWRREINNK